MLDFTKIQFSQGPRRSGVGSHQTLFRAELHIGTEISVSEQALLCDKKDILKKQMCENLLNILHHHIYGELIIPIREIQLHTNRAISPYNDNYEEISKQFKILDTLLKKP